MKIDRIGRLGAARAVAAGALARRDEPGISESELTPRVRETVAALMGEIDRLRQELTHAQARLEDVERAADQDQLLPLLNRRAFVRELTRHIGFAARYGTPASLVYFDLDGFKRINDTFGHAAGDEVLRHFAGTLLGHVRESDVVGRLGGDEFGVILSHADLAQANRKAASLMETLSASPAQMNGMPLAVGYSYGAFELVAGENADTAIARADEAMYRQKRAAR
jgi:diguanylate cyclase (GGDEF)-like protein